MAERLVDAYNSSSQCQPFDPELNTLLLNGGAALSELLNTQFAHTQVETPKDSIPKRVMGSSATNATTLTSDRGSPGRVRVPNSTTECTTSPNAPYEQAEQQTHHDVQKSYIPFTTTMNKSTGEGLKTDLVALNATDMYNNIRGALRGIIVVANDSKTAIPLHKFMDPKATIETMLGGLSKILGIKSTGTPDAEYIRALPQPVFDRLEEAVWAIEQSAVENLAQILANKIENNVELRSLIERLAESLTETMDPTYLTKILNEGSSATLLSMFATMTTTAVYPMTYRQYNIDAERFKRESSRSMTDVLFSIVEVFTTLADEHRRLTIYAKTFFDTTLLPAEYPLQREVRLTSCIGELRIAVHTLLKPVLNAVENGQPVYMILAAATKADREIQEFRALCKLPTRAQAIAAQTATATKQTNAKAANAAALVAEPTPPPPPPTPPRHDGRKGSKSMERKEFERPIVQDCIRTSPSPDNKKHKSNACIKYNVARILDKKSHTDADEACKRSGKKCQHIHVLSSDIRTENERVAAATSLDAQD